MGDDAEYHVSGADELPITSKDLAKAIANYSVMSEVMKFSLHTWPSQFVEKEFQPYK